MIEYEKVCLKVCQLVRQTGVFIQDEGLNFNRDKIEVKGVHDLVSYVDKEAEQQLVKGLSLLLPEAGFITEEKTINKTGEIFTWIIDPLDGTTNFMHGLPVYSISIALMQHEELVIGVVLELNRDELFYAFKDGPAMLNSNKIQVSTINKMGESLIATGFPYSDFKEIDAYLGLMKRMMVEGQGLRRLGSAAIDLCYVACGRFETYFEFNINSYDVAGGMFILQRAGGRFTTFKSSEPAPWDIYKSRQILASNGLIHDAMLDILNSEFLNKI